MRRLVRRLRLVLPLTASLAIVASSAQAAAAPACGNADLIPSEANGEQVRHATLCLLNHERVRHHLPRLVPHSALAEAAAAYAGEMVDQGFFGHVSPAGSTMTGRIRGTAYLRSAHAWTLGENLAYGAGGGATPAQIVAAWMRSPPHRRNVLDPRFRKIGVGLAFGAPAPSAEAGPATYVTEFGRRG
jgi:uncharacterized protein YkwD